MDSQDKDMQRVEVQGQGRLVLQTVAMPKDANASGDIFGGWLVSQMDLGGSVFAQQCARNRVSTVAIDAMVFLKPVYVGDLVGCYATVLKTGKSSISVTIKVFAHRMRYGACEQVTEGTFTFVALDDAGKPNKHIAWDLQFSKHQP
jgi:acyl-CoA thioesterase YciA